MDNLDRQLARAKPIKLTSIRSNVDFFDTELEEGDVMVFVMMQKEHGNPLDYTIDVVCGRNIERLKSEYDYIHKEGMDIPTFHTKEN